MSYPYGNGYSPPQSSNGGGANLQDQPPPAKNAQVQHWYQSDQHMYGMNDYSTYPPASSAPLPPQQRIQQVQNQQFISPAELFQQASAHSQPPQSIQQTSYTPNATSVRPIPDFTSRMAPIRHATTEVDDVTLLISLAEEYFLKAHEFAPAVAVSLTESNVEAYGKLITLGLGLLQAALNGIPMAPRMEAKVRLRYAAVVFEDTENLAEAELTLHKGISLCDTNHYFDLKYAMQFLLAQIVAKKSPKASIKTLETHMSEARTYQQMSWLYAFGFLRATICLQSGTHKDNSTAIHCLKEVASIASTQQDYAVHSAASLMEAMILLSHTGPDAITNVESALGKAWSNQLSIGEKHPQLLGFAHMLQVSCSIRKGSTQEMTIKLKEMQVMMDGSLKSNSWGKMSDVITLPINRTPVSSHVSQDTRTIIAIGDDGRDNLMLSFLSLKDAYAIMYLLSGIVLFHRNSSDHKAMRYLDEGFKSLKRDLRSQTTLSAVLPEALLKTHWRKELLCYYRIFMTLAVAATGDWITTKEYIEDLQDLSRDLKFSSGYPVGLLTLYLSGVYYQGTGDFGTALAIYQNEKFKLPETSSPTATPEQQLQRDLALIALLNSLCVLQDLEFKDVNANTRIINELEPLCAAHPNTEIKTAFQLILATIQREPPTPLYEVKNNLKAMMHTATLNGNSQIACIGLNVMYNRLFTEIVSTQAEKSAQAALAVATKSANPLWISVAEGQLSRCLEVQGKTAEARKRMQVAIQLSEQALPNL